MFITLQNEHQSITLDSFGAEWCSWKNHNLNKELIWQAEEDVWPRHAPILFPFVGELKSGAYQYRGKTYNMGRHGFARECEFAVVYQSEEKVTFALKWNSKTLNVYPFEFELKVTFELNATEVIQIFEVENPGLTDLLFNVGAHPAFVCNPHGDFHIKINGLDELELYPLQENGLLEKDLQIQNLPLTIMPHTFDRDALVAANYKGEQVEVVGPEYTIRINSTATDLGIWAKPNAHFVCIEPWWGHADFEDATGILEEKEGVITLIPGDSFKAKVKFQLS